MSAPYRDSGIATSIGCPRCGKLTPPGEIAACGNGCGVWIPSAIADQALLPDERRPSRLTSWARERVGCPVCITQMTLRGHDMTLFQGCDEHGFWIDGPVVMQTGLGRPTFAARLEAARARTAALAAEEQRVVREARELAERKLRERDAAKEHEEREAAREREVALERERALTDAEERRRIATEGEAAKEHEAAKERERMRADAEERERIAAQREAALAPFLMIVRSAARLDERPLAELLQRLESQVSALAIRVVDLERRLGR